ncbi:hypothetical protein CEY16_02285 [Halalkalibacillus sediminis]|uniref:Flagellar hook-length control protein-like C-terminal domain-containing protein n=1 Tax=Halalkalibacillus sediminis TaxID=2018042 RepID=A0A2I0QWA7_9BACI|nr:hypothetical protein [Halalkalibacillus sediminis]PKR78605.1 hypothetical protein CEY16_02285 [Halalkalibacillus sediminis]
MNQSKVSQSFQAIRVNDSGGKLSLREGQMVTGKVTKFFPDNKAQIRIGNHQLVAQLDTSLQANKNYLMQVKQTSPVTQLQVMSDQVVRNHQEAAQTMLQNLGVKGAKADVQLIASFLRNQVPIQQGQVQQLLQLAQNNSGTNQTAILQEMVQRQLPLDQQMFNSINQRVNHPISFSQNIQSLQMQLGSMTQTTNEKIQLANYSQLFSGQRIDSNSVLNTMTFQVLHEIGKGSTSTFQLFQKAGLISNQMSFNEWSAMWKNWSQSNQVQFQLNGNGQSTSNLQWNQLPINFSADQLSQSIKQFNSQQVVSQPKQLNLLQSIMGQLSQLQQQGPQGVSQTGQNFLQNSMNLSSVNQMINMLPDGQKQLAQQLQSQLQSNNFNAANQLLNSQQGQSLMQSMQQLVYNQASGSEQRALQFWNAMMHQFQPTSTGQMDTLMNQMKGFMQLTQHESFDQALVTRNQLPDYPSMQTLMKAVSGQMGQANIPDSMQQLNQIFQSIHLSTNESVKESIQFSTQLPKELFGLNEDLWMDFEGQKEKDGSIHPRQCRVMFYLDLPQLQETVIDMQVRNGEVDLNIFHDSPERLKPLISPLQPGLEKNLQLKEYTLNSVEIKPLSQQEISVSNTHAYNQNVISHKGVDYRI